jgi:predicted GIY-YIG superfamily endonuclease
MQQQNILGHLGDIQPLPIHIACSYYFYCHFFSMLQAHMQQQNILGNLTDIQPVLLDANANNHDCDNVQTCAICHRCTTVMHPVHFEQLTPQNAENNTLKMRQFGDRDGMVAGADVCLLCSHYVCPRTTSERNTPKWRHAWPAVIWTCLTRRHYADVETFMHFWADDLRASWHPQRNLWLPAMRQGMHIPSAFEDKTQKLRIFQEVIHSGQLTRLVQTLDDTCFPDVRCPMGCYMYIDDDMPEKLQCLPACHYLAVIIPKFIAFNAQSQYFDGARSDWTVPVIDLDWRVVPTLIVDRDHGLSIMMCSHNKHCDGRTPYVHVPSHPLLRSNSPAVQDFLAPAIISAKVVKSGRSNQYNTSFPVFQQQGSTVGLSTMRLSTRPHPVRLTDDIALCSGLTLTHRPDILEYCIQSDIFESETVPEILDTYRAHNPPLALIEQCARQGTIIDDQDAYLLTSAYNLHGGTEGIVHTLPLQQGQAMQYTNPHDCLVIVHPNSTCGHVPFDIQRGRGTRINRQLPMSWLLYCIVHIFLHVRILHTRLLCTTWHDCRLPIHKQILKVCKQYAHNKVPKHTPVNRIVLTELSSTLEDLYIGPYPEECVAHVISELCGQIHCREFDADFQFPAEEVLVESGVLILTRPDTDDQHMMPQQSTNGEWILMYATSIDRLPDADHVHVCFRWSTKFTWQHTGTREHVRPPTHMCLGIYIAASTLQRARDETIQRCGGQSKIRCLLHGDYLIRQQLGSAITCCSAQCRTSIRWRCGHGLGNMQCDIGLCFNHFRKVRDCAGEGATTVGRYGPDYLPVLRQHVVVADIDAHSDSETDNLVLGTTTQDDDDTDIPCDPLQRYGIGANDYSDTCPLATESAVYPSYLSERSCTDTLGHYLLNNHLRVLNRPGKSQKPPVRAQTILQSICANTPEWTVPLLYPESQLFPRIFWHMNRPAVTGALPAFMFTDTAQTSRKNLNVAPLKDHMYVRLMDGSLLTSRDFLYLQFNFDVALNSVLNRNSATIACHKGLEHLTRDHSTQRMHDKENILGLDELDARREVKRLSALLRSEGAWDYFVTLTCNDSATMGVWPIRAAIVKRFIGPLQSTMLQNYAVIMCRSWERTVRYIWHYIQYSPERPLGHVKNAWMRYEFQSAGALGNRPHVHGGITLHPEREDITLARICCSMKDFFTESAATDMHTLITEGFVHDCEDFVKLHTLAYQLQTHDCQKAGSRCLKRSADDSLICRVQRHPASFAYHFNESESLYDEDTLQRLQYLDLGAVDPISHIWRPSKEFRAGRWNYPAQPHEHFVPTVPRLFVAMKACTNVQFCDRKFQVSYLAKYAAGIDEKRHVSFTPGPPGTDSVNAEVHAPINIKITGQAMKASKKHHQALGREIALTEMIWFCAGLPYVTYPTDMTHVSTMPPEYRAAVIKRTNTHIAVEGGGGHLIPVEARRDFPVWRQFTHTQQLAMEDHATGSYYLDVTTGFSLRPPELTIFDNLEMYAKWFTFKSVGRQKYTADALLASCPWIDGAFRQVRLRHAYVACASQYIRDMQQSANPDKCQCALELSNSIFEDLDYEHYSVSDFGVHSQLYLRFVDVSKTKRNVVVFTQVTPTQFSRFLVHLMLSSGNFVTEIDLYTAPTMLEALQRASLIPGLEPTEVDVKRIARDYVLDQLQWLAVGTRRFSKLLQCVLDGLHRLLIDGELVYDGLPLYLERDMVQNATLDVAELEHSRRNLLVDALCHELGNKLPDFPDAELLKQRQVVPYAARIHQVQGQSAASLTEQTNTLQDCVQAINQLFAVHTTFCKWPLLVGPPGSGKTHILLIALTYALSRGLNGQLIAMTSERARRLGGEHIHLLFGLPVLDNKKHTISSMAETTLFHLGRSPIRLAALQRIDVLCIEEIGLVSAETFAVMDLVLRHIRDSQVPMGGILIIASGDPRQLPPVSGTPIWASYHLTSSFRVNFLQQYVRAQHDVNLQTLLQLLRKSTLTDLELQTFETIIRRECIPLNCVASWMTVPSHVLRVVGTRAASSEILHDFLEGKKADPFIECVTFQASDEIEAVGGQIIAANRKTIGELSYKCLEPSTLVVFVGAVMRLTYNNVHGVATCPRFSQGQLCVVLDITHDQIDEQYDRITVKLVPPGLRDFDAGHLPLDWSEFQVKRRSTAPIITSGRTKARRKQFPLCHFVCSTIHKALGETLPHIATQLSLIDKRYRLWQREQLLVLLSRVPSLNDITFVTVDPEDTIAAILNLLQQPSRWAAHVDNVLHSLNCSNAEPCVVYHDLNPLPNVQQLMPDVSLGFVYMIVSTTDCRYAYVGETSCIRRRLQEHNSGHGAQFTNDPYLRPWALMVLICGFPDGADTVQNSAARKAFERQWHMQNARLPTTDVRGILANGQQVFATGTVGNPLLLWQQFLHVQVVANR